MDAHASSSTSSITSSRTSSSTMPLERSVLHRDIDIWDSSDEDMMGTCPSEEEIGSDYELEFAMNTGPQPPASSHPDQWSITWPQTLAIAMGYGEDEGLMEDTVKKENVANSLGLIEKFLLEKEVEPQEYTKKDVAQLLHWPMGGESAAETRDSFQRSAIGILMAREYPELWMATDPAPRKHNPNRGKDEPKPDVKPVNQINYWFDTGYGLKPEDF